LGVGCHPLLAAGESWATDPCLRFSPFTNQIPLFLYEVSADDRRGGLGAPCHSSNVFIMLGATFAQAKTRECQHRQHAMLGVCDQEEAEISPSRSISLKYDLSMKITTHLQLPVTSQSKCALQIRSEIPRIVFPRNTRRNEIESHKAPRHPRSSPPKILN